MTPAPLLPSSDEVEKLLAWLDNKREPTIGEDDHGDAYIVPSITPDKNAVATAALIRSLQSELGRLRAQGDAEWNAGRDAGAKLIEENSEYVGGAGAESVRGMRPRKKGDLMAMGYAKAIRALTRPTTPSPDEAKGGE